MNDEESVSEYVGKTVEQAEEIASRQGYRTAMYLPGERIDRRELSGACEWILLRTDESGKKITEFVEHYVDD